MPRIFNKIILCVCAILWTLLAAEAYLRLFAPVGILPRFIEEGEHGIRRNIPGERYVHSSAEYRVDFSINEQGVRDPRVFDKAKPKDVLRIVLLGDSFAIGYGVSYQDSVPARLESKLAALLNRPVEVINLGVSGFGTAEELIALENDGWSFDPDFVMAYWHSSDAKDNVRSQLYELAGAGLIQKNDSYLPAVALRTWLFSFPAYRFIAEHSHFYNWIRGNVGRWTREILFSFNSMRSGAKPKIPVTSDVIPKNIRLSLALLERIKLSCAARGVPFIIAEIPTNPRPGSYSSTFPYQEMNELGYSFDVIDPIPMFEQAYKSNDGALIYWQKSAGHWTPLGTSAMVDAILEYFRVSSH